MTLVPGTRIGPYEVTGSLGAGGMGEVYRARDGRLGRDVAIKILPERFELDAERRARFDREARALASLNHPNIGAIYGIEESVGTRALVLELIPGPTLADRLHEGPLPLGEALRIATQIASALAAAHERGIVHRDLKPANVILAGARRSPAARGPGGSARRESGPGTGPTVKVVDFGLAKEIVSAGSDRATAAATLELDATQQGVLVGTLAYMSPEQARGERVDQRTDLWAFGCVLYEMLTGRAPHHAATLPDTLAAIVTREPDWNALPAETPSDVRRLLRRCLERDPAERLRDAHDLRLALEDRDEVATPAAAPLSDAAGAVPTRSVMVAAALTMVGGVILGMLVALLWIDRRGPDATPAFEKRLEIVTPPTEDPMSFALSPDGRRITFVANVEGKSQLWLRSLDSTAARPLPGTENAEFPFWSPDGQAIAFFADRALKRVDLEPGSIQVLAAVNGARGGSWGPDGTILMQPEPYLPDLLVRVAATGGKVMPYEAVSGRFPHFLPGGRSFIYYRDATGPGDDKGGVFVASLDGSNVRKLLDADGSAVYTAGHILFVRGAVLLAQKLDPESLALSSDAFPVAADVSVLSVHRGVPVSAAADGAIVYRTGNVSPVRQFVWVDRSGRKLSEITEPLVNPVAPRLSPDGSRVAFFRRVAGNNDVYLLDLTRSVMERLTTDPTNDFSPVWSPDGGRIAYCSAGDLVIRSLADDVAETLQRPTTPGESACADSWSRDGRFLLYSTGRSSRSGLWVLPIEPRAEPIPFANSDFLEIDGAFSPDGKWIAYTSDESGQPEVFVGRFPGPPRKQRVSSAGGGMAVWRHDGRELFYVGLDGKLMSVPLEVSADGEALEVEAASPLFDARVGPGFQSNASSQYGVAPDGKRFLLNRIVEQSAAPLTVVLDWQPRAADGHRP